eukprot:TRINITY_DN74782_c0_g1_i1.p1 TRINITY_DN74782_c0_g1~~TRINITY_DN74782_c0_g1_i1.p1  ORF type:complete len:472 (-),score=10.67 TRINITY_DN74782_c0_g1_i1:808-2055(-)
MITYTSAIETIAGAFTAMGPIALEKVKARIFATHKTEFTETFKVESCTDLRLTHFLDKGKGEPFEDGAVLSEFPQKLFVSWDIPESIFMVEEEVEEAKGTDQETMSDINKKVARKSNWGVGPIFQASPMQDCIFTSEHHETPISTFFLHETDMYCYIYNQKHYVKIPLGRVDYLFPKGLKHDLFNARFKPHADLVLKPENKIKAVGQIMDLCKGSFIQYHFTEADTTASIRDVIRVALKFFSDSLRLKGVQINEQRNINSSGKMIKPDLVVFDSQRDFYLLIVEVKLEKLTRKAMTQHVEQLEAALASEVLSKGVYGVLTNYHRWIFTFYKRGNKGVLAYDVVRGEKPSDKVFLGKIVTCLWSAFICAYSTNKVKICQPDLVYTEYLRFYVKKAQFDEAALKIRINQPQSAQSFL